MYGFLLGVYSYSLKMYVFEKVRARNFGSSWGFVQACQAIPIGTIKLMLLTKENSKL